MKLTTPLLIGTASLTLVACGNKDETPATSDTTAAAAPEAPTPPAEAKPVADAVTIDLRMRENADAPYVAVKDLNVPKYHKIGDGMFPYEGIGWENKFVGYRMYLDDRAVTDIFGKQTRKPALANIDADASYHELSPWGMDVLKVGPSLGIGGIGVMDGDAPRHFGPVSLLRANVVSTGGEDGRFDVSFSGIKVGDVTGDVMTTYTMSNDSPLTRVRVIATEGLPTVTGLVAHEGTDFIQSTDNSGAWQYIATYGAQSENNDNLGMALFYQARHGDYGGIANQTHMVTMKKPAFTYGFLAAWERDALGVTSQDEFVTLIDEQLAALNLGR